MYSTSDSYVFPYLKHIIKKYNSLLYKQTPVETQGLFIFSEYVLTEKGLYN
jgi:hypothetical protein